MADCPSVRLVYLDVNAIGNRFGRIKIKRCRSPCAYYPNSIATFHLLLIGDLVFKLNPGPVGARIPTIASIRDGQRRYGTSTRNMCNLINMHSYRSTPHVDANFTPLSKQNR